MVMRAHPPIGLRQKGPPDFFGVLPGGMGILFDAKSTESRRLSFGAIPEHQARALEAWEAAGGVAGIAAKVDGSGWWIPWTTLGPQWWRWREEGGRPASVDLDWLGTNAGALGEGADWLRVVGRRTRASYEAWARWEADQSALQARDD